MSREIVEAINGKLDLRKIRELAMQLSQ